MSYSFSSVRQTKKSVFFKLSAFMLTFLLLILPCAQVFADDVSATNSDSSGQSLSTDTTSNTGGTSNTNDTTITNPVTDPTTNSDPTSQGAIDPNPQTTDTTNPQSDTTPVTPSPTKKMTSMASPSAPSSLGEYGPPPPTTVIPGSSDAKQVVPQSDPTTGAMVYTYNIDVPPGRNGVQPDIKLQYNSQNATQNSVVGYGWSVNIPYIQRQNKTGSNNLYTSNYFTSSMSGDLVNVSGTTYAPRVEKGDFTSYTYSGGTWTATDKSGTVYTFGSVAASRQDDPSNPSDVYKWMLEKTADTNGNFVTYTYFKDAGQIYPDTITYTNNGSSTGAFSVVFTRASRPDAMEDATPAFKNTTNYRISEIETFNGTAWVKKYDLAYTTQAPINRSLLSSVTISGQDGGTVTTKPADTFQYQAVNSGGWTTYGGWVLPADQYSLDFSAMLGVPNPMVSGHNVQINLNTSHVAEGTIDAQLIDVNGDGLPDIVQSYRCLNTGCMTGTYAGLDKTYVYLNTGSGWVYDSSWTTPADQYSLDSSAMTGSANPMVSGHNVQVDLDTPHTNDNDIYGQLVDVNGDGLPDIIQSYRCLNDGCMPTTTAGLDKTYVYLNTGSGWVYAPSWTMPADQYSLDSNAMIGSPNPMVSGHNVQVDLNTSHALDNSVSAELFDVNGDGRPDIVQSWRCLNDGCLPTTTAGLDKTYIYINTGSGWVYDNTWTMPADQYSLDSNAMIGSPNPMVSGHNVQVDLNTRHILDNSISASFSDVNGDGLPDIVQSYRCLNTGCLPSTTAGLDKTYVYLNTGDGWKYDPSWTMPADQESIDINAMAGSPNPMVSGHNVQVNLNTSNIFEGTIDGQLVDINGDGLPDIIQSYRCLNTGCLPSTTAGLDNTYVYLNTGSGWLYDPSWTMPADQYSLDSNAMTGSPNPMVSGHNVHIDFDTGHLNDNDVFAEMSDANGDGMPDIVQSYRCLNDGCLPTTTAGLDKSYIYQANYTPLVLTGVNLGTGGSYAMTYKPVSEYTGANNAVPYVVQTLNTITTNDGFGTTGTTTYTYSGGTYYFNPLGYTTKKFAGFKEITATDAAGNVTKTYYHTGNGTDTIHGEYADMYTKIGEPYRVEQYDASGHLFTVTINKWDDFNIGLNHDFVKLIRSTTETFDGGSSHRDTANEYQYDNTNGNLLQKINWGEVTAASDGSFTDIGTDKSVENMSYAIPVSGYVTGAQSDDTVLDQFGSKVRETRAYYDTLALGSVNQGNPTKTEKWVTGTTYVNSKKTYDPTYGTVLSSTDPDGNTTTYTYDPLNLYPAIVTDALTHTTNYQYDYATGKTTQTIDPNGFVYQTTYDGLNRVLTQKIPDLTGPYTPVLKTSYIYTDTTGAVSVQETDYLDGATTVNTYTYLDGLDRPIQTRKQTEVSGSYDVSDTVYNNLGQTLKQSLPYTGTGIARTPATTTAALYTINVYDAVGRTVNSSNATGTTINQYSLWNTIVTDPMSKVKEYYKDAYGNLVQVDEHNGASIYSTYYIWNLNGKLNKLTDALGNIRDFTYDGLGERLSADDLHAPADLTFGVWNYAYDNAGNLIQSVSPNANTVNYTYDAANRNLTENWTGGAGTEVTYGYDTCFNGVTKLCSVTMLSGANTIYKYDSNGNVTWDAKTIGTGGTFTTQYKYNRQANLVTILYPNAGGVQYVYGNGGQIAKVQHNESGGGYSDVVSNFNYSPTGQPTIINYANGVTTTNTYDASHLYRLATKTSINGGSTHLQDTTYSYDPDGNITNLVDASGTDGSKTVAYTYDDLNRLLSATATGVAVGTTPYTHTYTYDAIGNITNRSDVGAYVYSGTGYANPHAATKINGGPLTYDNDGNELTDSTIADAWKYVWNYKDEPTEIDFGTAAQYEKYDYDGTRVAVSQPSSANFYPNKYYELDWAGNNFENIYAGNTLVATVEILSGGVFPHMYYVHTDDINGSNVVSDSTGAQNQLLDYYPYGNIRLNEQATTFNEEKQFGGHYSDDGQTNLNYFGARYYDPSFGRFVSEDPSFLAIGDDKQVKDDTGHDFTTYLSDPQSLNSYSYAENNPITKIDSNGKSAIPADQFMNAGISLEGAGAILDSTIIGIPVGAALQVAGAVALGIAVVNYSGKNAVRQAPAAVSNPEKFGLNMSPGGPEDWQPQNFDNKPKWMKAVGIGLGISALISSVAEEFDNEKEGSQNFLSSSQPKDTGTVIKAPAQTGSQQNKNGINNTKQEK